MVPLSDFPVGKKVQVMSIDRCSDQRKARLMALGVVPGEIVTILRKAPLADPLQIKQGYTFISIRRADAREVLVQECDA